MSSTHNLQVGRQRLLHQDVQILAHRLDRLLRVHCGDGGNENGLETLVLDHLVVVIVELHAIRLEVLLCPLHLGGLWREGSYELRPRGPVQKICGVTLAHAAQTRRSKFESPC